MSPVKQDVSRREGEDVLAASTGKVCRFLSNLGVSCNRKCPSIQAVLLNPTMAL